LYFFDKKKLNFSALFISPQAGGNKANKFRLSILNHEFRDDGKPIDPTCECYTCQNFSRAYIRHLFMAKELLAFRLATYHNIYFIVNLVKKIREAIINDEFAKMKNDWLS
jgi:tRNA-guanine family transglycosylase